MEKYSDWIFDSLLRPASGASVLVRPTGVTTQTSTLYGDAAGTATRANPVTAGSDGGFWFYGSNGRYDLVVSGANITTTTETDIMLEDVPRSNLSELTTASTARDNLGLGSAAVVSTATFLKVINALSELSSTAATVRTNIGAVSSTSSQSVSGGHRGAVVALASTGQITPNFSTANNFSLAMTVDTTLAAGTAAVAGQLGCIVITQNSTAKTLAYDSGFYKFAAAATATLSTATAAGTRDVLRYYIMDSTSAECEMRNGVA
jgi:hypothetical protein